MHINIIDNLLFAYYIEDSKAYNYTGHAVIESSPNTGNDFNLNEEAMQEYAALLTGLLCGWNIDAKFCVYFNGMSGWSATANISKEDFDWLSTELKLNPSKYDVVEALHDYLMDYVISEGAE